MWTRIHNTGYWNLIVKIDHKNGRFKGWSKGATHVVVTAGNIQEKEVCNISLRLSAVHCCCKALHLLRGTRIHLSHQDRTKKFAFTSTKSLSKSSSFADATWTTVLLIIAGQKNARILRCRVGAYNFAISVWI